MTREPQTTTSPAPPAGPWRREVALAAGALVFGLVLLPPAIYVVGQRMLGEYEGGGVMALSETIWSDLLSFRLAAWLLVLSPYLALQLLRGARRLFRREL